MRITPDEAAKLLGYHFNSGENGGGEPTREELEAELVASAKIMEEGAKIVHRLISDLHRFKNHFLACQDCLDCLRESDPDAAMLLSQADIPIRFESVHVHGAKKALEEAGK